MNDKKHGLCGKPSNNFKDEKLESVITFRCKTELKAKVVHHTQAKKIKLRDFVIEAIDEKLARDSQ
jgi:hypothetical protein